MLQLGFFARRPRSPGATSSVGEVAALAALIGLLGCASNETPRESSSSGTKDEASASDESSSVVKRDDPDKDNRTDSKVDGGGLSMLPVAPEAAACAANLPFKPQGCGCDVGGQQVACWSGDPRKRNTGKCHDGVQTCSSGEFGSWGPCEGEEVDCGDTITPPAEGCTCVPGTTIACDEDCSTLVICSLTGTKVCQPDGTFGPCREQGLAALPTLNLLGCRNFFHGCLPGFEGVYTGDCSKEVMCSGVPLAPPAESGGVQ